jgi:putative transposase
MRKENPVRYSSAVGEAWMHFSFKTKYAHNIFDIFAVRNATNALLIKACKKYKIPYDKIGFDSNHVHGMIDINNYSRPEAAKLLRGYIARKLFKLFPWLKRRYFWGSGLWNPAYFMDSIGKDMDFMKGYIMKQKYAQQGFAQIKLTAY